MKTQPWLWPFCVQPSASVDNVMSSAGMKTHPWAWPFCVQPSASVDNVMSSAGMKTHPWAWPFCVKLSVSVDNVMNNDVMKTQPWVQPLCVQLSVSVDNVVSNAGMKMQPRAPPFCVEPDSIMNSAEMYGRSTELGEKPNFFCLFLLVKGEPACLCPDRPQLKAEEYFCVNVDGTKPATNTKPNTACHVFCLCSCLHPSQVSKLCKLSFVSVSYTHLTLPTRRCV